MVKLPQEMESLAILVQNVSLVLVKINEHGIAAALISKILGFLSFISDNTKCLIFYTYSGILMKQMRLMEAKNYCRECLKLLEKPVHIVLAKLKGSEKTSSESNFLRQN